MDLTFNRTWSYRQFDQAINRLTALLKDKGIASGDRIACVAKNRAEIPALHFACLRAGAIFVPLNWRLSVRELNSIVADCKPKLIFVDLPGREMGIDGESIDTLLADSEQYDGEFYAGDPQLPSLILYTSGTLGTPKGVVLSEENVSETAVNFSLLGHVTAKSVFLCESPMFHIIGLVSSVRAALLIGGRIAISDGFVPARTLARMEDPELEVTHYFCVPQMAKSLREEPGFDPDKLRHMTAVFTGGAPHPADEIRSWLRDGIPIVDGYGMSEAGTIFGMPVDLNMIEPKAGCVGFASHRIRVRLADEYDREVGCHVPGEVQLKGASLALGYWNKEEAFAAAHTDDGWFRTGDVAVCDEDGYYRIVGRKKDMIISGGENIYPSEVEFIAKQHEGVYECALVGMSDERWGEVGCLFVVPVRDYDPPDKADLIAFMKEQLASYKLPKQIRYIGQLPRNAAGKVVKKPLVDQLETDPSA
jgi:fatty-acyl-CoA synthase